MAVGVANARQPYFWKGYKGARLCRRTQGKWGRVLERTVNAWRPGRLRRADRSCICRVRAFGPWSALELAGKRDCREDSGSCWRPASQGLPGSFIQDLRWPLECVTLAKRNHTGPSIQNKLNKGSWRKHGSQKGKRLSPGDRWATLLRKSHQQVWKRTGRELEC